MCGIAGIIDLKARGVDSAVIEKIDRILAHRGPDGSGTYKYSSGRFNLVFLHRRLKILDLSERAKQPICNETNDVWLVFNGEIYNYLELKKILEQKGHIFKSGSDSEIVVHAWEEWQEACLKEFNGMFAFAVWDEKKQQLFCARDRLGIKPFYYYFEPGENLFFSSELKPFFLLKQDAQINFEALYQFLLFGHTLKDLTWIKGVQKLLPGEFLIFKNNTLAIRQYWSIEKFAGQNNKITETDAKQGLRALLEDSVRLHLRSDVPVGAYLSGGIDSSAVVALASQNKLSGFKVFSGIFNEGSNFDEQEYIDEVVSKFSLESNKLLITEKDFFSVMEDVAWHIDEPVAGPGAYSQYCLCRFIKENGYKVVLGGQGGDELFGGYSRYLAMIPNHILHASLAISLRYFKSLSLNIKAAKMALTNMVKKSVSLQKNRINSDLCPDILKTEKASMKGLSEDGTNMFLWDIKNYLPALLQVEDRMGMAFSIESRLPLLDHRIVESAFSLPLHLKINRYSTKYILRKSVEDLLPGKIFARRDKKGFPTPFNIWLGRPQISGKINEEIRPFLGGIFKKDSALNWEKVLIGLWLKKIKEIPAKF